MNLSITPGLLIAGAALVGLTAFSGVCALRWMWDRIGTCARERLPLLLAAGGVGLLVFGARLWVAGGQVSWTPYLDQWHAEIAGVVAPVAHGTLDSGSLVAPSNEHRVVLSRVLALASIALNGVWDNRVEVLATFVLQSATAAWICALAWSCLGWARGMCVCLPALLPMLLVCDWENIVSGFQTQFCFMVLGSVVAFSLAGSASDRPLAAWGALATAALLLGSMASGLFTALTMAMIGLFSAWVTRQSSRSITRFCAVAVLIALTGWFTRVESPPNPWLVARNLSGWAQAFFAYASWPLPPAALGFVGLWLPSCILLWRMRSRRSQSPLAPFVLSLGLWVLLQAGALAWARASLSSLVSSRYTEVLAWGYVANAAALVLVLLDSGLAGRTRFLAWAAVVLWIAGVGGCEVWRSEIIYRPYLADFRRLSLEHERRLLAFMKTDDAQVITGARFPHIPGPAAQILPLLRDSGVRALMPAPLPLDTANGRDSSTSPPVRGGVLSTLAGFLLRSGKWVFCSGALLLLVAGIFAGRSVAAVRLEQGAS